MGNSQNKAVSDSQLIIEQLPPAPIQRWANSEQTHEDMLIFLQSCETFGDWTHIIHTFLRSISNRQKYQNYVIFLLEFVKSETAAQKSSSNDRKQLYTYYINRLKNSFFTVGEFYESTIDLAKRSNEKLFLLYEYYSLNEQLFNRAILHNYPTIFTQFPQFIENLLQTDIIITNYEHFSRFVIPYQRLQQIIIHFQISNKFYVDGEAQQLMKEMQTVHNLKEIYLGAVQKFMKYDYADISSLIMRNLVQKGYKMNEQEIELQLKIQLYSLFLYELGKLSLTFSQFSKQSINQMLHYFYSHQSIQQTQQLIKCFDIFESPNQVWRHYAYQYIFSPISHISTFIKLLQHRFITFNGSFDEFHILLTKIKSCKSDIGRYSEYLCRIAENFQVDSATKNRFIKLIKIIEVFYLFQVSLSIETLSDLINLNKAGQKQQMIMQFQEYGLQLIKQMLNHYFKHPELRTKHIVLELQEHILSSIYQFFNFMHVIKKYLFSNYISDQTLQQIIFQQLINHQHYVQVKALLENYYVEQYKIKIQTIEIVVMDQIISLMVNNRIKKVDSNLILLMSIVNLWPNLKDNKEMTHFVIAYYSYFKYLEDRDVILSTKQRENISLNNLYFIANNFTTKIQILDFNYLFELISCIRAHHTSNKQKYSVLITDQFLKFKIYLSNRAFSTKKIKLGNQIIDEIIKYQPPWLSTQLVKICRENPNCEANFVNIAFNHCARGEDMQYIFNLHERNKIKNINSNKILLKNIRKLGDFMNDEHYLMLNQELVIHQQEYKNLVAQMTYSEGEQFKKKHSIFFKLMTVEPDRAFYYAINYEMPVNFIINFMLEGAKKNIIHLTNLLPFIIRYLYFAVERSINNQHIKYKKYKLIHLQEIFAADASAWKINKSVNVYAVDYFMRMVINWKSYLLLSQQFLDLYINDKTKYSFIYDQKARKDKLVELRDQPMTKSNCKVLRILCQNCSIDIVELSLYNLYSRINLNQSIDDQCWTIVQKLIFWGSQKNVAYAIVQKMSQKISVLGLLVSIYEYIRESQQNYKIIVTQEHLDILKAIAAVQYTGTFMGIIPDNFFQRQIGVYPLKNKILTDTHRRILKQFGSVSNIFVLSKALYFIYGCSQQIEKIVLSDFSLQQEDSQQFQLLRKKIKNQFTK